jgi:hypothetical protein
VRAPVILVSAIALALAGCGDDGNGDGAVWDGPPEPSADGTVAVDEFGAYLDDVEETWEGSAATVVAQFLRIDERTAARTTIAEQATGEGTGPVAVVVTLDGLFDDSVRAERWTSQLVPVDSTYELESARRDLRCQPGRGHQTFAPEPCT